MSQYATIKAIIDQVVTTNGQQEITGALLNEVLNAMVDSLGSDYQFGGVVVPVSNVGTPDQNVFYIAVKGGTYTNFGNVVIPNGITIFMWNGSWSNQIIFAGDGGVFDITAYNNNTKYADLTAALGTNGANIPQYLRKGGMSVKFVLSSDNKYVQFRYMLQYENTTAGNAAFVNPNNWQGVDNIPIAGSKNLVESDGIKKEIDRIEREYVDTIADDTTSDDFSISDPVGYSIVRFGDGHIRTKNFNSKNVINKDVLETRDVVEVDFSIGDNNDNAIVEFNNGHIKTKNFDSSQIIELDKQIEVDSDLSLTDENYYSIAEFINGHIKTKNFDSSQIGHYLYRKKIVFCGDSFTAYTAKKGYPNELNNDCYDFEKQLYKTYAYWIAKRNGMILVNEAKSGSTMTYTGSREDAFSRTRYQNIPSDADYIILKFGINDENEDANIGTISDNTNTTFYGAWNVVMSYLIANHPYAKIGIIITNGASMTPSYSAGIIPYLEAEIAIAKKYGVGFLNEGLGDNIPLFFRSARQDVEVSIRNANFETFYVGNGDNHPCVDWHKYESTIVENWIKSL